jgi:hypothetical protein
VAGPPAVGALQLSVTVCPDVLAVKPVGAPGGAVPIGTLNAVPGDSGPAPEALLAWTLTQNVPLGAEMLATARTLPPAAWL